MNLHTKDISKRVPLLLIAAIIMALAVMALGAGARPAYAVVGDTAVVNTGQLAVRNGPGPGYLRLTTVQLGEVLTMQGRNSDSSWINVKTADGTNTGWVSTFYIQANTPVAELPVLADAQFWGFTTAPVLNVRTGPGLEFSTLTTVKQSTYITILGRNSTSLWLLVMVEGVTGWAGRGFIVLNSPVVALPVVASPAAPTPVPSAAPTGGGGTGGTGTPAPTAAPTAVATTAPTALPTAVPFVPSAVITTGELNVRTGPGPGFSKVTTVVQGDKVLLLGRDYYNTWVFIQLTDTAKTQGWISTFYIQANMQVATLPVMSTTYYATGLIVTGEANLRVAPGLDSQIITTLTQGTFVGVLGRNADGSWLKISASGVEGWVGGATIGVNVPISTLPEVQ